MALLRLIPPACLAATLLALPLPAGAETGTDDLDRCVAEAAPTAADETTLGELRARCRAELTQETTAPAAPSAMAERLREERRVEDRPFAILPHRPNYLLMASWNEPGYNEGPFIAETGRSEIGFSRFEAKLQLSIKSALGRDLWRTGDGLYFGYTMRAFWQLYENNQLSRPFREYNHEPELWYGMPARWELSGFRTTLIGFGINHQSNGQTGLLSRSWNRVFGQLIFERENFTFGLRGWARIQESATSDDNPDIEDFLGNFEFYSLRKLGRTNFGLMLRHNLDLDKPRGAFQLDWSFPLHRRLRGYVQWFNGYGESLIDYNQRVNSFGFGVKLSDWL